MSFITANNPNTQEVFYGPDFDLLSHQDPDIAFELEQAVENALNRAHLCDCFSS